MDNFLIKYFTNREDFFNLKVFNNYYPITGLFLGISGIGLSMLKQLYFDDIPNILVLD